MSIAIHELGLAPETETGSHETTLEWLQALQGLGVWGSAYTRTLRIKTL